MLLLGLMLVVSLRMVDQLPNGFYTSYPIFLAGGLYSLFQTLPTLPSGRRDRRRWASDGTSSPDRPGEPVALDSPVTQPPLGQAPRGTHE